MKPIVITGVSGFIGGHVWSMIGDRDDVWGLVGATGSVPFFPERQQHVDFTVPEQLKKILFDLQPRCILHLGAISSIGYCEKNSLLAWRVNHVATRIIAEYAATTGNRLIFASTDQVFDGAHGNYDIDDRPNPVSTYGETKKAAERAISGLVEDHVIVRINNCYGPAKFRGESFSGWIVQRRKRSEPFPLFKDQVRSFVDVVSVAAAFHELIDHPYRGILHLGGKRPLDRVTFARALLDHLGYDTTGMIETLSSKFDKSGVMTVNTSFKIEHTRKTLQTPVLTLEQGLANSYGEKRRFKHY